jgi:site-specific DNA recombinase
LVTNEDLKIRAALYARNACATQTEKSTINSQMRALRAYANKHGLRVVGDFTDEGLSGLQLGRPGLDGVRDLAKRRGFDVLLTCDLARLARGIALQALIMEELERCGVVIIFPEAAAPFAGGSR